MNTYCLSAPRYEAMKYRRCGNSGLVLPEISLGFWHNFGEGADEDLCRSIVEYAFDNGITYFDLANNYGPPVGSAEILFGKIFAKSLKSYREEIVVATKVGHDMWPGPYGEWGGRKMILASIDQSLKRMGLDYVDIYYSHRPDFETPIEETMEALVDVVRSGKALYVGLSKYPADLAAKAYAYLKERHCPCVAYQGRYNMVDRVVEADILPQAAEQGAGFVAFSPLAQGLLTGKYLGGVPVGSRMTHSKFLKESVLTDEMKQKLSLIAQEAEDAGFTPAQYALRWVLSHPEVSSVIVGASSVEQLKCNLAAVR